MIRIILTEFCYISRVINQSPIGQYNWRELIRIARQRISQLCKKPIAQIQTIERSSLHAHARKLSLTWKTQYNICGHLSQSKIVSWHNIVCDRYNAYIMYKSTFIELCSDYCLQNINLPLMYMYKHMQIMLWTYSICDTNATS